MDESDPGPFGAAFARLGWDKPPELFRHYLAQQGEGRRACVVAEWSGERAGYVTLVWVSQYEPFAQQRIPEVVDLNVLPAYRRRGIGTALLDRVESIAGTRNPTVGIGVGLYADYGAAQRMYARRGYIPDGRGLMYRARPVRPGATVRIDDDAVLMLTRAVR
jgi:GNAT superfamily N-acetyltransferase